MRLPDLERTYETFLPLGLPADLEREALWRRYMKKLRRHVVPLIRQLQAEGIIGWYGFLTHDFQSGVPTVVEDGEWYLHLRVSLMPTVIPKQLFARLPSKWRWTRPMAFPHPPYLDRVEVSRLTDQDVRLGWALLGDFSEWALRLVEVHDPDLDIPYANVAQLVHYLDNMLLLDVMRPRLAVSGVTKTGNSKAQQKARDGTKKAKGKAKKSARRPKKQ